MQVLGYHAALQHAFKVLCQLPVIATALPAQHDARDLAAHDVAIAAPQNHGTPLAQLRALRDEVTRFLAIHGRMKAEPNLTRLVALRIERDTYLRALGN